MQNVPTREFQRKLIANGYEPVRKNGSHTIYEAERTITDSMSVPTADREINGCLARRLEQQMEKFVRR
jgi:predicted RNA binding protein YcfA (HicA-like mRNA interferase family)